MKGKMKTVIALLTLTSSMIALSAVVAQQKENSLGRTYGWAHGDHTLIYGAPSDPSKSWTLARGGLIYDNWWAAMARERPSQTHPSYPKAGKKTGADTWRCTECHGWDYKGKDGQYAKGPHATGVKGINAAKGRDPKEIMKLLRAPFHGYTSDMIHNDELARVALFVSRGQHNTDKLINNETGDVHSGALSKKAFLERGHSIYQTTCAVCHGFDARRLNFGTLKKPTFISTEAKNNPWKVLHKMRNAHPGVEMISLRAFPIEYSAAVLAYLRTLPSE